MNLRFANESHHLLGGPAGSSNTTSGRREAVSFRSWVNILPNSFFSLASLAGAYTTLIGKDASPGTAGASPEIAFTITRVSATVVWVCVGEHYVKDALAVCLIFCLL